MPSYYYFIQLSQGLLLAALMGFLIHRLRQLPSSRMLKALIILMVLSAIGLLMNAIIGPYGIVGPPEYNSQRLSLRGIGMFIAGLLSPFANEFCLIALTVLVCHPARSGAKAVVTREERYPQT